MSSNGKSPSDYYYHRITDINMDPRDDSPDAINNNGSDEIYSGTVPDSTISSLLDSLPTLVAPESPLAETVENISVYNIRSKKQCYIILTVLSIIAFLQPFCDTMYLPALPSIRCDLHTTNTLVLVSISVYMFVCGIMSLLWGSIADRFGRKITLIVALIIFMVASIVCIFAPNITVLIVFRALQGTTGSSTIVIGQAVIADIYPEETRGSAAGFFFLPYNIGPVVGPFIGGPLSEKFGWRSTFVFTAIYSAVALIAMLIMLPETHQYFVKEKFHKANSNKRIIDASPNEKLPFQWPWRNLLYLVDLSLAPYIAITTTTYSTLVTSFTLFPTYLHESPYNYSPIIIGALYIPSGVVLFISSILGGWLSDKAAKYSGYEKHPADRIVPGLALSLFSPIGFMIFGWTLQYKVNVAGPIMGLVALSFGQGILEPVVSSYLTIAKQEEASSVSAANVFANFVVTAILVTCAVPLRNAMGTGPYFSLLSGVNLIAILLASIAVYKNIRRPDFGNDHHDKELQPLISPDS